MVGYYGARGRSYKKHPKSNGRKRYMQALIVRRGARIAERIRAQNKRTGGFAGREAKFLDTNVTTDPFTTAWLPMDPGSSVDTISAVAQGIGESQRVGRAYRIHSISIRGFMTIAAAESATAPVDDTICRIALVLDKQTNAAQLSAPNVYSAAASSDVNSFRNMQFIDQFDVLKTVTRTMKPGQTNEGAANLFSNGTIRSTPWSMHVNFNPPIKVVCPGTTGVVASVADNSFHVIGTATSAQATLTYTSRVRYSG